MIQRTTLDRVLKSSTRDYYATVTDANRPQLFADVWGFHIYGELNLTLRLAAAEDTADAQLYLGILQEYTLIAETCAAQVGAHLLEVQGERIHLLFPAETVTKEAVHSVVRFSIAFTSTVYARIGKRAGDAFKGFRMATDHGRAILVKAGDAANGSLISLGPAANAPAKRLRKTEVGCLAMRGEHFFVLTGERSFLTWVEVPVHEPTAQIRNFSSSELSSQFDTATARLMEDFYSKPPTIRYAQGDYLNQFLSESVTAPAKVQGYCLRADLDGFSKQVQAAFERGDAAIFELVQRFFRILMYPDEFGKRMGRTIKLPMAGDCANILVIPNGSGYEDSRDHYPAKVASEWHNLGTNGAATGTKWSDELAGAKWSVGVAGGGDEESAGIILIAPLKGRNRDFLVAAGWGVGRSLDAQESDDVHADDTVVPDPDYKALDTAHRKPFKPHGPFWLAKDLTIQTVQQSGIAALASSRPLQVASVGRSIPASRPHANPK